MLHFTKQVYTEPSRIAREHFVAHQKFILNDDQQPDCTLCLIVRKHVPRTISAEALHTMTEADAQGYEEDLRDMADELGWK